ncbi:hypothetical protein [Kitasatospora sp. NPDC094011]|uniref:hypothetical protein n=1 Tax=Kitasatospora sp. NPDC094011 TaxID=3364090 RepID=UPI00381B0583
MTSPDADLLLPYRCHATPAGPAAPGGTALNRLHITIGDDPAGRTGWPVRCAKITLSLPTAQDQRLASGEPVILRTGLDLERGPGRGRQWLVESTTSDPTVTVLTLTPAEPARFDGTWSLTLTLDTSTPLGAEARITEDATSGDDTGPVRRTGSAALTAAPAN